MEKTRSQVAATAGTKSSRVSYRDLLVWLDDFDPHGCAPEVLLPVVEGARAEVEQRFGLDEILERLYEVEELLHEGEPCGDELEALFVDFPELPELGLE